MLEYVAYIEKRAASDKIFADFEQNVYSLNLFWKEKQSVAAGPRHIGPIERGR